MSQGSALGPADFQEMGRRALEELVAELPETALDIGGDAAVTLQATLSKRVLSERAWTLGIEPEDLGSVYEGTLGFSLELARELSSVVEVRRKAGQARLEVAVGLETLLALKGAARFARLDALGVAVTAASRVSLREARDTEALHRALFAAYPSARSVPKGRYFLRRTGSRRQSGSHYTSRGLAERVVELALAPLLAERKSSSSLLEIRVCDPAAGSGAFLVAACRALGRALANVAGDGESAAALARARARVAERCLYGIDRDPIAVEAARMALALAVDDGDESARFSRHVVLGDALSGELEAHFPKLERPGGFDAFIGNPPWVSYAGRAAQPLEPALRVDYARRFRAFAGYRNLQGLFVERAAEALRPGGRIGLLLPSSMSELEGYSATRRAHDRFCVPDPELPDIGEGGFEGVFQPCMVLLSTRRSAPLAEPPVGAWPLERPDLDAEARELMAKLGRPALPGHLFGERGLQSMGDDLEHLTREPDERHSVPLRCGSDIEPFQLGSASFHADPSWFGERLRSPDAWRSVRFVVRQTARVPIAALSDGKGFRNSLLAGFEDASYPAPFLVAYLNSSPIRWIHYMRHRDARHGMPQMKILHLRSLPAPPDSALVGELARRGAELSSRNRGLEKSEQESLDRRVADAFELTQREWERVRAWAAELR